MRLHKEIRNTVRLGLKEIVRERERERENVIIINHGGRNVSERMRDITYRLTLQTQGED